MYRSVIDFNYAEPRKNRYHVLGGAEGMIGGGGGYLMGGGLARGEERTYGCAADQVLELEMILPDGQHVKFGYV
jgi:FAD/FMN-containing dehydrogenase